MSPTATNLHAYQIEHVAQATTSRTKRWVFNNEMGVGKTAEAITACRQLGAKRILVVCPAIVRLAWIKEFNKWWPDHPEVGLIDQGTTRKTMTKKDRSRLAEAVQCPVQVVSYNLVPHVAKWQWDIIILDECHRLKNPKAKWAKDIRKILFKNTQVWVFGLTATLMPDKPLDACGILEAVWPGRFGGLDRAGGLNWKCKQRYANAFHNGYGWIFNGVNPLYVDELRARVETTSSRTTKLEIAHLMPPYTAEWISIPGQLSDCWTLEDVLAQAADYKVEHAKSWAEDALESVSHICIMTHQRKTVEKVKKLLTPLKLPIYSITGEQTPGQRNVLLMHAKAEKSAIVIATMHSIGIGIDLTFCPAALFVELYWRPETVIQAMGRFSRLSGKVPSSVTVMAVEGTQDEIIADKLRAKIEAINSITDTGLTEQELLDAMEGTEEDFLAGIDLAISTAVEDDYV